LWQPALQHSSDDSVEFSASEGVSKHQSSDESLLHHIHLSNLAARIATLIR